jgi:hypothetical protein
MTLIIATIGFAVYRGHKDRIEREQKNVSA